MAHVAGSSARNSFANEGVVWETSQAVGDTQTAISRDVEDSTNIFSCLCALSCLSLAFESNRPGRDRNWHTAITGQMCRPYDMFDYIYDK